MTNYSIKYMDAAGRTKNSEYLEFTDNRSANDYARIGLTRNAIVEIWRGDDLVTRLHQSKMTAGPTAKRGDPARLALHRRADRDTALSERDNEGGGGGPVAGAR